MSCINDLITPKGTLIYFNSGSIYTNCDVYTGLTSTSVTGITTCTGMTTGNVCDLQGIDANLMEIYVRLDCEGCCDKTYRINLDECLCYSGATPTPTSSITPTTTPSITPTSSITPTTTPSITPTSSITPSITPTTTPSITLTPSLTPSQSYNSLGLFFSIAASSTAGCALFTGGTSPNTEYFTFGFSVVDFYTNPVGKSVYVDSPPFGFGLLGTGYIVTSNGCRYELTSGVVQNTQTCSPGGSCLSPI
jgi:hypothetical protein